MADLTAREEGAKAFHDGINELDCPYDMELDWSSWVDWTCGHSDAMEAFYATKEMHEEAREKLDGKPKKFGNIF